MYRNLILYNNSYKFDHKLKALPVMQSNIIIKPLRVHISADNGYLKVIKTDYAGRTFS